MIHNHKITEAVNHMTVENVLEFLERSKAPKRADFNPSSDKILMTVEWIETK